MVTALIVINQSGKPAGSPGVSRDDLALGTLVVLTNNDNTGVDSWLWELESKPVGSSAALSGATGPTASFMPDVRGSYMVKLTVDGPSASPDVDTRIGAVKTAFLDMRKPATGEQLEFDGTDGWSAAMQAAMDALDADAAASLKADASVPLDELSADPGAQSNKGFIYAKDVAGITEFFYEDSSGNTVQITSGGAVNISGAGNTLDEAYDQGGAGAGRQIAADSGEMLITASGDSALGLQATTAIGGQPLFYTSLSSKIDNQIGLLFEFYNTDPQNEQYCLRSNYLAGPGPLDDGHEAVNILASMNTSALDPANVRNVAFRASDDSVDPRLFNTHLIAFQAKSMFDIAFQAEHGHVELQDGYLKLHEFSGVMANDANLGLLFTSDVSGVTALFYMDSAGSLSRLDGYSPPTLDLAYDGGSGSGAGRTVAVDSGPILLNVSGNDSGLVLQATGALNQEPILKTDITSDTNSQLGAYFRLAAVGYSQQQNVTSDLLVGNMPSGGFNAIGFMSSILIAPPFPGDDEVIAYQAMTIDPGVPVDGKFIAYDVVSNGSGQFDFALRADYGDVQLATGNLDLVDGYVVMGEQSSDPPFEANRGSIFTKDIGGVTALFYIDDTGILSRLDGYAGAPGATSFTALTDTPSGYAGAGNLVVRVRGDETGLEFATVSSGAGTLHQAYLGGNTIWVLQGYPVHIDAYDAYEALNLDGYLGLRYLAEEPDPLFDKGLVYAMDAYDGYMTPTIALFYMNHLGQSVQLTKAGNLNVGVTAYEDELDPATTLGTETYLSLSVLPQTAMNRRSLKDLDVYRNGVLMRFVPTLGANPNQWRYNYALNRVEFVASGTPGDWYVAIYRA